MLELMSNSHHGWLSTYVINVSIDNRFDSELGHFLQSTIHTPLSLVIINQEHDLYLLNYIQLQILHLKKDIVVSFTSDDLTNQLSRIDKFVDEISKLELGVTVKELSKQELVQLMLKIPNFMNFLEQEESIETAFHEFVSQHESIKEIVRSITY
ncbi:hypothetical protein G210_0430 [Candida maltosa Xu316]|uniref:Uncharacterized protein n=1 Tax=Candida maltosa (strain Xu316) TaxID=1245528 RepID=M3IQY1_CANMX|nr:hypothetical protein G210_0430 [Candida maltosa Xu316]